MTFQTLLHHLRLLSRIAALDQSQTTIPESGNCKLSMGNRLCSLSSNHGLGKITDPSVISSFEAVLTFDKPRTRACPSLRWTLTRARFRFVWIHHAFSSALARLLHYIEYNKNIGRGYGRAFYAIWHVCAWGTCKGQSNSGLECNLLEAMLNRHNLRNQRARG